MTFLTGIFRVILLVNAKLPCRFENFLSIKKRPLFLLGNKGRFALTKLQANLVFKIGLQLSSGIQFNKSTLVTVN